ncbi:hypothetical protein BHE74_00011673 [Ensete ventricosum]|nr:hypothetical protein BHE74_00011673 [Ensete ventricosum]
MHGGVSGHMTDLTQVRWARSTPLTRRRALSRKDHGRHIEVQRYGKWRLVRAGALPPVPSSTRARSLGSTHPTELKLCVETTAGKLAHTDLNQQYLLNRHGDRPHLLGKRQIFH